MIAPATNIFPSIPASTIHRWGAVALRIAFGALLVLLLGLAYLDWRFMLLIPALCVGLGIWLLASANPLLHLCLVIAGAALAFEHSPGLSPPEIIYGLYYLNYLLFWMVYHVLLRRDPIITSAPDALVLGYFLWASATFAFTFLYGGDVRHGFSEWLPTTYLLFYFPIRYHCIRHKRAFLYIASAFAFLALFVVLRNAIVYYIDMQNADAIWKVMANRERLNERFLLIGSVGAILFLLHARQWFTRAVYFGLTSLYMVGVVISQARALWVAIVLALAVAFVFLDAERRTRMIVTVTLWAGLVLLAAYLILGDFFMVVLLGLLERLLTLQGAATRDVSLVNRFVEWQAAFEQIRQNPILGHGFGVDYSYYSLVFEATYFTSHVHNTFIGIWYRHGLVGLSMYVALWTIVLWRAWIMLRASHIDPQIRLIVLICFSSLLALLLASNTEAFMLTDDSVLVHLLPMALVIGIWDRRDYETRLA